MLTKRSLTVVKQLVLAGSVLGVAASASAQPAFKGTFTLPYEVRWGQAVLQPGRYTITVDSLSRPALLTRLGGGGAYVMAVSVGDADKNQPSAILVTRGEKERIVRSFNCREAGQTFVYKPLTKGERERYAKATVPEALAIVAATK